MRRGLLWLACSCFVVQLIPHAASAASWEGLQILPKSLGARLVKSAGDTKTTNTVFDIDWPATVAKVDGQWLQISDPGAYSNGPVEVWVRKDDITKLDDARCRIARSRSISSIRKSRRTTRRQKTRTTARRSRRAWKRCIGCGGFIGSTMVNWRTQSLTIEPPYTTKVNLRTSPFDWAEAWRNTLLILILLSEVIDVG